MAGHVKRGTVGGEEEIFSGRVSIFRRACVPNATAAAAAGEGGEGSIAENTAEEGAEGRMGNLMRILGGLGYFAMRGCKAALRTSEFFSSSFLFITVKLKPDDFHRQWKQVVRAGDMRDRWPHTRRRGAGGSGAGDRTGAGIGAGGSGVRRAMVSRRMW